MPGQEQREEGGIAPAHYKPGTMRRWVNGTSLLPLYPQERPFTHFAGGWVGLRGDVDDMKYLASPGVRSPDRQARNESLYYDILAAKITHACYKLISMLAGSATL
jgi:hypothetical protein